MKHILGAVLLCLLAGCASTGGTPLQGSVILPGVLFFKQEAYQCGPAVLATVVDYWHQQTGKGNRVTPEQSDEDLDRIWEKTGYWTLLLSTSV